MVSSASKAGAALAAQLTATVVIGTIHVLVGAIHAALLMALEAAAILFGFVAIGYAVRGLMWDTVEMQSKAIELVSNVCTLHIPIILAEVFNFLLCAVVATHIRGLVAQQTKVTQILLVAMFLLPVVSAGDAPPTGWATKSFLGQQQRRCLPIALSEQTLPIVSCLVLL